jgi:group I intron endonuclease
MQFTMRIPCDAIHSIYYDILHCHNKEKNMIGIYLITNNVNGKVYVGQSINIERRYSEHLRSGQPEKYSLKNKRDINTPIHLAMQKYGISNFSLSILEECLKEELDDKERFWIHYYDSTNKEKGYNIGLGGQESFALKGENHSQAKLNQKEVNEIKKLLKETDLTLTEINDKFPFVSKSTLSMINQGKIWSEENESYPIRIMSVGIKGSKNKKAKFTDEQVMEIRKKYAEGQTPNQLYPQYNHIATNSAIKAIIYGESYKNLPIYKKSIKKWIEPCIDYPQSLK